MDGAWREGINHELHFTAATAASLPPFRGANSISSRGKLHISRGGGGRGGGKGGGNAAAAAAAAGRGWRPWPAKRRERRREAAARRQRRLTLPSSPPSRKAENRGGCQPCDASRGSLGRRRVSQSVGWSVCPVVTGLALGREDGKSTYCCVRKSMQTSFSVHRLLH